MTTQKTKSLTLSDNPVARLRELADLDILPHRKVRLVENSNAATQQHSSNGSQQSVNAATQERINIQADEGNNAEPLQPDSAQALERPNTEAQPHSSVEPKKRGSTPARSELPTDNPVKRAMRQALIQPYSEDLSKGPSTATTIRILTEIWERLDMASTLQDQTKQDIIAEALKHYLKRIGRGEA